VEYHWWVMMVVQASTLSSVHCKVGSESVHEDFFTKQARLQAEAKLALAQVPLSYLKLCICRREDLAGMVPGVDCLICGHWVDALK